MKYAILFLLCLTCLGRAASGAEFSKDGSITGKSGKLGIDDSGKLLFSDNGGKIDTFFSIFDIKWKWHGISSMHNLKRTVDAERKSVVVTGLLPGGENGGGVKTEYALSLQPDGRTARVSFNFPDGNQDYRVYLEMNFLSRDFTMDRSILVDDKPVNFQFDQSQKKRFRLFSGEVRECIFQLPADRSLLKFQLVEGTTLGLAANWNNKAGNYDGLNVSIVINGGKPFSVDINLDDVLQAATGSYRVGEMEFGPNQFRLPNYELCRNLIQNPSFEDGLYFWADRRRGIAKQETAVPDEPVFLLDESTAAQGKRSLRQTLLSGIDSTPCTFAIPVKPQATYTLSLYAKTDAEKPFDLHLTGFTQATGPYLPAKKIGTVEKDWQRMSLTFTAPNKLVQIALGTEMRPAAPCHLWIDAVQLEETDTMTDFTQNPLSAAFVSDHANNLFQPGEAMHPGFRVWSEIPTFGQIAYRIRTLQKKDVKEGNLRFQTQGQHEPVMIALPEMTDLEAGTYTVEAELTAAGFHNTLYYRFTLMPDKSHSYKHRRLFTGSVHGEAFGGTLPKSLEAMAKAGIGSQIVFTPPTKAITQLILKHDMQFTSTIFAEDPEIKDNFVSRFLGKYQLNKGSGILAVNNEDLPQFEEHAFRMASRYPEVKFWKLINEPTHSTDAEIKRSIEVLTYTCRGIRRGNPAAKIFTPDPGSLDVNYLLRFWNMGGKDICDYVAAHPYRVHPEVPDLDQDIAELLKGLPATVPVYFTEGNYFCMYELPENFLHAVGNDKSLCADFYRGGHFTYDSGFGELAAVAHRMRYRLQVLKYADRVQWDNDWGLNGQTELFGLDVIPNGLLFSVNTLASLLGDATFKSDILFGEPIRCYLFEDGQKRPVAALWNYDGEVFQRPELVSRLDLTGLKEQFELFNLVGAHQKVPTDRQLPVDGCPVFLRGQPGRTEEFRKQLVELDLKGGKASDFKIETAIRDGALALSLKNIRAKPRNGNLKITANAVPLVTQDVKLPPEGVFQYTAKLPDTVGMTDVRYQMSLTDGTKVLTESAYDLSVLNAPAVPDEFQADGELAKWNAVAPVTLPTVATYPANPKNPKTSAFANTPMEYGGEKDLSAEIRVAYNSRFLFLLVKVADNVYHPADGSVGLSYQGDSLQIYFDSQADARNNAKTGFGEDDQAYDIRCQDGTNVEVNRSVAPFTQLAFTKTGIDKNIRGVFRKIEGGYYYDLAFPLESILPIKLKNSNGIGISVLVNDNDNDYRKRAVYLNRGAEPFHNPKTYPLMLLR